MRNVREWAMDTRDKMHRRMDDKGTLDAGEWTYLFVAVVVLVLIVAALFPVLTGALGDYADNETTFGPILQVIVPLVFMAGLPRLDQKSARPSCSGSSPSSWGRRAAACEA